jgi:hypothetical protein
MAGLLIYHGCKGHNTIYRDLTYSGQGVRGEKTNSKGFDITWVGG